MNIKNFRVNLNRVKAFSISIWGIVSSKSWIFLSNNSVKINFDAKSKLRSILALKFSTVAISFNSHVKNILYSGIKIPTASMVGYSRALQKIKSDFSSKLPVVFNVKATIKQKLIVTIPTVSMNAKIKAGKFNYLLEYDPQTLASLGTLTLGELDFYQLP